MTTINRIMELGGAKNEAYERYLKTLPKFELEERLRILEAEQGKVSRGWRTAKRGQLEMLPVIMARAVDRNEEAGRAETSSPDGSLDRRDAGPTFGLPDLGKLVRNFANK